MKKMALGIIISVSLFTILLCGGGGYAIYRIALDAGVTTDTYNSIALGTAEAATAEKLPEAYAVPTDEVYAATDKTRSGMPAKTTCRHYFTQEQPNTEPGRLQVYRFCFTGGKLVEKKLIPPYAAS